MAVSLRPKRGLESRQNQAGQGHEVDGGGRRRGCSFGKAALLCIPERGPARGGNARLGPCESAIFKPRWGAFFQTPLQEHLTQLGVTSLAFTGCNFPNCPRASIYEASERDFRIVLVEDGVSGLYDRGREEMLNIGVTLLTADQLAERVTGD